MRTFFKVMLYLLVLQLLMMGALALAAPEWAGRIWNFLLKDPALARIVGPPWLALGMLCLLMARDLDRYRAVAWVPFLGTWLQFVRAVHGLWSGKLAPAVAASQISWEGIFGALGLIAYLGAYRKRGGVDSDGSRVYVLSEANRKGPISARRPVCSSRRRSSHGCRRFSLDPGSLAEMCGAGS